MVYGLTGMISVPYTRRLISQHAISRSLSGKCVRVVYDETDIGATAAVHSDIADALLAMHAISGVDIVLSLHGVGKATVIQIAKKGTVSLSKVGDVKTDMKSMQAQAAKFMCAAYGKVAEPCTSMTECRVNMWRSKTGKRGTSSIKLCSLPMTRSSETLTDVTCKSQHGKQHFSHHHRQWT